MNREQFAHVLRAAAAISNEKLFVVLGSQAALGQFETLPPAMARSVEVDLYPGNHPELADLIEGSIGADSMFHEQFGYYADAVGPETSRLPRDWQQRAVRVEIGEVAAICPEIHDLAVSKLLAGREKDFDWLREGIGAGLIDPRKAGDLLIATEIAPSERRLAESRLERIAGQQD